MSKSILVHEEGAPEVLRWEDDRGADREPGRGEVRLRQTAVGVNYIDVYFRTGVYKAPQFPFTPGFEGAGVVEAVGPGVPLAVGDRVAYAGGPLGAYAERRVMPADPLVKVPDGIDDRTAAAMMLKGMTAQYLLRRLVALKPGDPILFHAAAGGVGLIACQWARALGLTVIGTVGSDDKAALAREHGCHHVINYRRENFVEKVKEITEGKGVPVVYDSVGKDTFYASLDCLRPRGMMVSYGQASGPIPPLDVALLSAKGSLFLTRPVLFHYTANHEELSATAGELFDVVKQGKVRIPVRQTFPLAEAAKAHHQLQGRQTTGSTVLLPG